MKRPKQTTGWPTWNPPREADILSLARLTIPFIRVLRPEIVNAVVEDNERHRAVWAAQLHARGIDPQSYLWERSPCAFPGVRRYAGSTEIAQYRGRAATNAAEFPDAVRLDDNSFPKHIWSFVFRGRPFQNFGPNGYALAHLADHKAYGNRNAEEFEQVSPAPTGVCWHGFYTSVANSAYVPTSLIKPTDFAGFVRNLLQRRVASLYGKCCNLLPPCLKVPESASTAWSVDAFEWSEPVGSLDHMPAFLKYRHEVMEILLKRT
jgi:hypothetical protein